MSRFRKKPVDIEAVRWTGNNWTEIKDFGDETVHWDEVMERWWIETLEGDMTVNNGDWIIKGVQGEFYPCKPDIFEATYEIVEQSMTPAMMDDMVDGEG